MEDFTPSIKSAGVYIIKEREAAGGGLNWSRHLQTLEVVDHIQHFGLPGGWNCSRRLHLLEKRIETNN
jgi:hypothetical protein